MTRSDGVSAGGDRTWLALTGESPVDPLPDRARRSPPPIFCIPACLLNTCRRDRDRRTPRLVANPKHHDRNEMTMPTFIPELEFRASFGFDDIGRGPFGARQVATIAEGKFIGERLSGTTVGAGADWLL